MNNLNSLKNIYSLNDNEKQLLRNSLNSERINYYNKNSNIDELIEIHKEKMDILIKQQSMVKQQAKNNNISKVNEVSAFFIDLYTDLNEFNSKIQKLKKKQNVNDYIESSSVKSIPLNSNVSMNINNNNFNLDSSKKQYNLGNIDPYKLYGFKTNKFTLNELKEKFREYALQTHPDKNNGDSRNFNIIKNAFRFLYDELKKNEVDKQFLDLKNNSKKYIDNQLNVKNEKLSDNFDLNKFNTVYNDNKIETTYDNGYSDWITANKFNSESISRNNKLTTGNFNDVFNKQVKVSNEIINYEEPKTLYMNNDNSVLELGTTVKNYTGKTKNIAFTDYKEAHTTNRLVDPNSAKNHTYSNINELEQSRSNIKELTQEELLNIELKKSREQEYEQQRIHNLQRLDNLHFDNYDKLNKLMLR
jgi:curved DNA-binding protein CbpA